MQIGCFQYSVGPTVVPNPKKIIIFAAIKTKPDSLTSQGLPGINTTKVVLSFN